MIVVLGSVCADHLFTVDKLPSIGQTISSLTNDILGGGKGANQALAAKRAGSDVALVGAVGSDTDAVPALATLSEAGVSLQHLRSIAGETGKAYVYVDSQGENFIVLVDAANGTLTVKDAEIAVGLAEGDVLILQQEIPTEVTKAALELARSRDIKTMLNIAPVSHASAQLAPLADIVLANEHEWKLLSESLGEPVIDPKGWVALHNQILVVTKGSDGASVYAPTGCFDVAAPTIKPVDTVGAGDTFCGFFAAAISAGRPLDFAANVGVTAASLACLTAGAQASIPTQSEVATFIVNAGIAATKGHQNYIRSR